MANDCLVTRLKGVVDNPDLPKLNEARITLVSGTEMYLGTNASVTLTIIDGNGKFSNVGSSITVVSDTQIVIPTNSTESANLHFGIANGDAVVSVNSKYNVNKIRVFSGSGSKINIEDFSYSPLDWLTSSGVSAIYGDVSYLQEEMTFVQIAENTHVTGQVKDLPVIGGPIRIQDTGITGELEKYVEKLFHKGAIRTNNSCYFGGGSITLDGNTWGNGFECLITVTASSATIVMGAYVNKTYDGTQWTNNL